jgi:predicted nucleic acid-binding protein
VRDVIVVDTSLAVKWAVFEDDSDTARALLDEWIEAALTLIVPALFIYEVTNTLYRKIGRTSLTMDGAKQGLEYLLNLGIILDMPQDGALSLRAMELAQQFRLPATYDAHYLALAEREACDYWTADERLWNGVKQELPWVRWLGSYHRPA